MLVAGGVVTNFTNQTWPSWTILKPLVLYSPILETIIFFYNCMEFQLLKLLFWGLKSCRYLFAIIVMMSNIHIRTPCVWSEFSRRYFEFCSKEHGSTSRRIYGTVPSWTMILICIKLYSRSADFTTVNTIDDPSSF